MMSFYGFLSQILLCTALLAAGTTNGQRIESLKTVNTTVRFENDNLESAFEKIEQSSGYSFVFDKKNIDKKVRINGQYQNEALYDILLAISKKASLRFRQVNNHITVKKLHLNKADNDQQAIIEVMVDIQVKGRITDESGQGLPGASVVVKGTSNGTTANLDGDYSLSAPENAVLVVSYVGYSTQEIALAGRSEVNVQLNPDTQQLSEVVVTAFGIEREKKALGYSAQEVKGDDLVEAREINVANSLKGKVAGVFVNSSSGGPGGSSFVQIRGSSSLSGKNQPLYVVDGIPISNDNLNQTNLYAGRDFGDGIKDINPDDIESISVLKGPNAAALYGSRGANGVILITTKKSAKKGIGVSFNSNATFESINVIPTFQNSYGPGYDDSDVHLGKTTIDGTEYDMQAGWMLDNWGAAYDGRLIVIQRLSDLGPVPYVAQPKDNIKNFYDVGKTFTNTIAVDGGSEKVNYRFSASNMDNTGIVPGAAFSRRTFSARIGADVTDRLHVEAKANFINSSGENRPIVGVSSGRNIAGSLNLLPRHIDLAWLTPHRNADGSYRNYRGGSPTNPYWLINEVTSTDFRDRIIGLMLARYKLTDWLTLQGRVGSDAYTESQRQQYNAGTPGGAYRNGRVDFNMYRVNELNADFLLTADRNLSDNLRGTFSIGANRYTRRLEKTATIARDMNIPDLYTVENADLVFPSYDIVRKEIQSVYLTGQLAYKNTLFLDFTARNDWSSTLGVNNQSFLYPSVSLSYALTDALELDSKLLTFAKLRMSYAQAGNDADPYKTKGGYTVETTTFKGQRFARVNGTVAATDLKNELTTSFEVGTDVRLLDNRVAIDFTYYNSRTSNQIMAIGLSQATSYDGVFLNAGEVSNKGIELFVSASPIKLPNSLEWEVGINFSKNRSIVTELVEGIDRYNFISPGSANIVAIPGEAYGTIMGYKYKRSPDGQLVVHESGNYYVREDDLSILGDVQPDWLAGVTNTISYKGISLSALVDIRMGGEIFSWSRQDQTAKGTGAFTENRENLILEGVIEQSDGSYTPTSKKVWGQHYWAQRAWGSITEEFVLDATYASLREATLGYSFSRQLLENTPFTTAKFSIVGRNLFYIHRDKKFEEMGISPETAFAPTAAAQGYEAFSMPTTRSIGFNLSLTF